MKHLVLTLLMHYSESSSEFGYLELEADDVVLLRYAANTMSKGGQRLEIHRAPRIFEEAPRLLIMSGWTAPLPHS